MDDALHHRRRITEIGGIARLFVVAAVAVRHLAGSTITPPFDTRTAAGGWIGAAANEKRARNDESRERADHPHLARADVTARSEARA
jgi:hypothetical protein